MGYRNKALLGFSWAWALSVSLRSVTFLRVIILARFLSPDQFGIYGIALLILALLETLTETGVNVILIQDKESIGKYVDSAWIISILRGIIISSIMLLASGIVANFFHNMNAKYIVMLFSLVPFIRGFINPSEVKFQKEVNFDKEFIYRLSLALTDAFISIAFVYFTHQIYGLVIGAISGVILQVILSFFLTPRPRFNINKIYLLKIFHSGKWLTFSGIFNYLFHNADNIIVGRILGTSSLGLYGMAYNISMLPITDVSNVISKVSFPVYTLISEDIIRLKKAFVKTMFFLSIIVIPFGIMLFVFTTPLVNLFLGEKWLGTVKVLKILSIFGVIQAIASFPSAMFLALGKQKYVTAMTLLNMSILLVTIFPLVNKFGLAGAGTAALLGSLLTIPLTIYFVYISFK